MNPPDEIAEALRRTAGRRGSFGDECRWFADVTSTNDFAARWAERGAPEGAVVIADAQSAGRGRHGRPWASPPAAGLYVSIVLRPPDAALRLLTITAGVAVADAIKRATGFGVALKWPNDVYAGGRKVAGLLAEAAGDAVILGIGINLLPAAYPPAIAARATSLEGELGRPVDRGLVLGELLSALHQRYSELKAGRTLAIASAWRELATSFLGLAVRCTTGSGELAGIAENIDDSGALLIRTATGVERVISGEVVWL